MSDNDTKATVPPVIPPVDTPPVVPASTPTPKVEEPGATAPTDVVPIHNFGVSIYNSPLLFNFPVGHATMLLAKDAEFMVQEHPDWFTILDTVPPAVLTAYKRSGVGSIVPHVTGDEEDDEVTSLDAQTKKSQGRGVLGTR